MQTLAVSAPPRVAERVRRAPDGPAEVLHRCDDALVLDLPDGAVAVTGPGAQALAPIALTTARWDGTSTPRRAYLSGGALRLDAVLGPVRLVVGRLVGVRAPRIDVTRVPTTGPAIRSAAPQPVVVGLVPDPTALVGLGPGLTPWGDDVLCGWITAHRAVGVATPDLDAEVAALLPRTTPVSAALLEAALAGECSPPVAAYLRCPAPATRAALLAVGATSGAGLALGIDLALDHLRTRRHAA